MRRALGIAAGLATQLLFLLTVWRLYGFLGGEAPARVGGALWVDAALAMTFGLVHSALLYPPLRERLSRWIAPAFYGLFYCAATCISLLVLFGCWTHGSVVWEVTGTPRLIVRSGFALSWGALVYSLYLTGLGFQTGWTPWWHWVCKRSPPPREFNPRGLYRWMRHPVYLSFLGLVWFTPVVTTDRALLIALWTGYLFAGSWLKDRRLAYYLGARYLHYQSRVPGYPGMLFGPLGKIARNGRTHRRASEIKGRSAAAPNRVAIGNRERQLSDPVPT
jgi:protein-S-isoprenylcysteine O-methyltransferase Ste14